MKIVDHIPDGFVRLWRMVDTEFEDLPLLDISEKIGVIFNNAIYLKKEVKSIADRIWVISNEDVDVLYNNLVKMNDPDYYAFCVMQAEYEET